MTAATASHDLIVIGGGINGAGIARDAALRGLDTLLLEAYDFGSGTSSWSSRLIHGGLRYLEYGEIPLVYESLGERRTLLRIAPHLVKPLKMVIPLYRGGRRPPWLVRIGMLAYDLLSIGKALPRHRMLDVDEVVAIAPGIATDGLRGAASYYDAQVTWAERLVVENVLAAAAAGAEVHNYCRVHTVTIGDDGHHRVGYRNERSGEEGSAVARCVVNAGGPFVDRVLDAAVGHDEPMPRLIGGTKGSHIIVAAFDGAPAAACYVEAPADQRPVFIIPWNDQYLIGTTDIRYDGDPAEARASRAELDYLLETVNSVFPRADLGLGDVHYAYSGVRPLPRASSGPESAITRRHIIHAHRAPGLLSIVGGKLTTFRNLAEQVTDRVERELGRRPSACRTARLPLPGAAGTATDPAGTFGGLDDGGRRRLASLYGTRCARLAELCADRPALARVIDPEHGVLAAEVVMALRDEFAQTLVDLLHRRLMVGLAADLGASAARPVLAVAAAELGWDADEQRAQLAALDDYNGRLRVAAG